MASPFSWPAGTTAEEAFGLDTYCPPLGLSANEIRAIVHNLRDTIEPRVRSSMDAGALGQLSHCHWFLNEANSRESVEFPDEDDVLDAVRRAYKHLRMADAMLDSKEAQAAELTSLGRPYQDALDMATECAFVYGKPYVVKRESYGYSHCVRSCLRANDPRIQTVVYPQPREEEPPPFFILDRDFPKCITPPGYSLQKALGTQSWNPLI